MAKPLKEYLETSLQRLTQQPVHLLEVERFLKTQADQMCAGLPLQQFPGDVLKKANSDLDAKGKGLPFRLGRLPNVSKALSKNLEGNKPTLDVAAAKKGISEFIKSVLVGPGPSDSLSMQGVGSYGKVRLSINVVHVVFVCLRKLSAAFKTLGSVEDLADRVIQPALAIQEKESCHVTRERLFNQMNRYAEALEKLEMMEGKALTQPDRHVVDTLVKWWPSNAKNVQYGTALGNDEEENTKFKSERSNRVLHAMGKAQGKC